MADCREIREKLLDFIEGELSGAEQANVAAHLDGCAECAGETRVLQALVKGVGALPELAAPSGFEAKVMARVRRAGGRPKAPAGWLSFFTARPALAGALAIFLVVVGAGVLGVRPAGTVQVAAVPSGVRLQISAGTATVDGVGATASTAMMEGNLLEVSADFRGQLVYPDGTSVRVRPGASVRVFARSLALKEGQVWLKVKKGGEGFQVETPQAVVAVRGTVFGVDYDPADSRSLVQVEEGRVEVKTAADSVMLSAGEAVRVAVDLKIVRQDAGFESVFDLNRDDFIGKPQKLPAPGGR